jgi:hypothetical protein
LSRSAVDAFCTEHFSVSQQLFHGRRRLTSLQALIKGTRKVSNTFPVLGGVVPATDVISDSLLYATATTDTSVLFELGRKEFSEAFMDEMEENIRTDPDLVLYNIHSVDDISTKELIGVVLLKKYYTVFNGKRSGHAIEIRCIVSKDKKKGMGDKMINLITHISELGASSGQYCYVFAQCVKNEFWHYRLDECNVARALILQVFMTDCHDYNLWNMVTMRASFTCKDKESPVPHD